jgi:hypothetical protein
MKKLKTIKINGIGAGRNNYAAKRVRKRNRIDKYYQL